MPLNESELKTLLEVAERAARLRPGPWAVHDSCSWRRIGSTAPYGDGDVISPTTQRDGHPDLLAEREVLDHVAKFDATTCAALAREVLRLRDLASQFAFEESGGSEERTETLRTFHGKDQYE